MTTSRTPSPMTFDQGVILSVGGDGGSVTLTPHKGDPNTTGLPGAVGMFVIDTDTGSTYKYDALSGAFIPSADVSQLPYPGPTPIKIQSLTTSHELDRVDTSIVRSIIWDVSLRNAEVGAYSSYVKAMHLGGTVGYVEYSILEIGTFPTYTPSLSVTLDGADMVLRYDGDAGVSASILRQQVEVDNG